MVPPLGRVGDTMKLLVHVRMFPAEIATVDACDAALRPQNSGAAFSRAAALRIAAMEWPKERHAQGEQLPRYRKLATSSLGKYVNRLPRGAACEF